LNSALAATLARLDDPACIHPAASFTEALARLHFAVEHRHGLALLLGECGIGKTTLLRRFRRELAVSPACIVQLSVRGLAPADVFAAVCEQLGLALGSSWLNLAQRCTELGLDQTQLVLLVDDAQHASMEVFEPLRRLWEIDATGQLRATLVVATDELAVARWPAAWLHRVDLRVELQRWLRDDVERFVDKMLGEDRKRQVAFEPSGIDRMLELSSGVPRTVRRLTQLALLAAQGQRKTAIDDATITAVSHELCWGHAALLDSGVAVEFVEQPSGVEFH
jgi:type II secretory pathway predicted ATPase ExeA